MGKIKYYLFDCFEVIFEGIISTWIEEFFPEEEAKEIIATAMVDVDRGDMSVKEMIAMLSKKSSWSEKRIEDEFHGRIKANKDMVNFIKKFSKAHNTYLLSNAATDHLEEVLASEPGIEKCFKRIYVSGKMHMVKPSKEYFEYVLKDLGAKGEECVFTDDNPRNLEGARQFGISTIQFVNFRQFEKEIQKYL